MDIHALVNNDLFAYGIMPLLIFTSRIIDVSIGTMRLIFISRGYKFIAAICGFFEVLIWIFAITQVMSNLTNIFYYIVYAAGFSTGNYVGMLIEEKIALGNVLLRVVTKRKLVELADFLITDQYGYTMLEAEGSHGNVHILFTILPRQDIDTIVSFIKNHFPNAFYTIEDIRFVNEKNISFKTVSKKSNKFRLFKRVRKGK
ncbi:DUF2179 domain-containing protein [Candidatus Latescibacterota bacterium]